MLPLGIALERTGAATGLASTLIAFVGATPRAALAAILIAGVAIGHFVPPPAATVLMAPIALNVAGALGTSALPFAMAIMAAIGMTILTPFSNPVMLMVMSPGGYRLRDYVRSGLPLVAILLTVMLVVIPLAYPFHPGR